MPAQIDAARRGFSIQSAARACDTEQARSAGVATWWGRALHLQEVAARVLTAALLRHVHDGAFQHLQQGLLHPLAAHIPCDADVLALLHNLVDLQGGDDITLCPVSCPFGVRCGASLDCLKSRCGPDNFSMKKGGVQ